MEDCMENLKGRLINCRHIINKGYTCMQYTRLKWLNVSKPFLSHVVLKRFFN